MIKFTRPTLLINNILMFI